MSMSMETLGNAASAGLLGNPPQTRMLLKLEFVC